MNDLDSLLNSIAAHPDEDTPRLMYADALDERGAAGDRDRAEFVRAQVEAAKHPARRVLVAASCSVTRSTVSFSTNGTAVSAEPGETVDLDVSLSGVHAASGRGNLKTLYGLTVTDKTGCFYEAELGAVVSPGEPHRARAAALLAAHPQWLPECPVCMGGKENLSGCLICHGKGWAGTMERGFLRAVTAPAFIDVWRPARGYDDASDTYQREAGWTGWALGVAKGFPTVELVRVIALRPAQYVVAGGYYWPDPRCELIGTPSNSIVRVLAVFEQLWERWPTQRLGGGINRTVRFTREDDAQDALAQAFAAALKAAATSVQV